MGDVSEKLPLHIVQLLEFRAHPIDRIDEVPQLTGGPNIQRRAEIALADLFDMGLQLAEGAQDRVAGKTGERDAKYERKENQLLSHRFGLRRAFPGPADADTDARLVKIDKLLKCRTYAVHQSVSPTFIVHRRGRWRRQAVPQFCVENRESFLLQVHGILE